MFINDLPSVLDFCSVHIFADDVQIYLCSEKSVDIEQMSIKLNHDLHKIFVWSSANLLPINSSKTKAMLICRRRVPPNPPDIFINFEKIEFVDRVNNLGIIF